MKNIFFVGLLFVLCGCANHDYTNLPYHLYSVTQNSDLNYEMISQIDSLPGGKIKANNEFYPIEGDYTVLRFLSFSYGQGRCSSFEANNLLVLKINSKKEIIDGYFYPLQWAEYPYSSILYKIKNKNIKIKNNLNIHSILGNDSYHKGERGYLVLPKDFNLFEWNFINNKKQKVCPYEANDFEVFIDTE